ncbi:hypothetical protein [uncultured Microbacterium sp.]|nr:hypothetical protein [uncultured Microbacterium sp.]
MTVIFVEGESDRVALEVLSARLGIGLPAVVAVGGASGARRARSDRSDDDVLGLVDVNERTQFEQVVDQVFVCDPDLEGELVRALGIDAVEAVIAAQGELASFRRLQNQPAQRGRRSMRSWPASSEVGAATNAATLACWPRHCRSIGSLCRWPNSSGPRTPRRTSGEARGSCRRHESGPAR